MGCTWVVGDGKLLADTNMSTRMTDVRDIAMKFGKDNVLCEHLANVSAQSASFQYCWHNYCEKERRTREDAWRTMPSSNSSTVELVMG